jgi:LPXTG-motif cell wall-anchored protein
MRKMIAAIVVGLVLAVMGGTAAYATDGPPTTQEVYWLLPSTAPDPPTGNVPSIWPQEYAPNGPSCGNWYQVDTYNTEDIPALIADGILHEGEDYGVVIRWRFEYGGDCPPPPTEEQIPVELTHADPCGPDNITVEVPPDTAGVRWETFREPGVVTVTATAEEGYVLSTGGTQYSWEYRDNGLPCDLPTPEPPALANTGPNDGWPGAVVGAVLMLASGGVLLLTNRNRLR